MAAAEQQQQQGFYVRAITDYYGVAADELDLNEGAIYSVIQTTESGWWYAIDGDGIDGWVPSNYLDKCTDAEQTELLEQQRKNAEQERRKHEEMAAAGAFSVAPDAELDAVGDDNDDEKGGASARMQLEILKRANNFRARQTLKEKAQQGDAQAQAQFAELEQDRKAQQKAQAAQSGYKGRKQSVQNENQQQPTQGQGQGQGQNVIPTSAFSNKQWKSDDQIAKEKGNKNLKWKQEQEAKVAAARKPKMWQQPSEAEMAKLDAHRPALTTVNMVGALPTNKECSDYDVDELLLYLTLNAASQNTFELKSCVGYLAKRAQSGEPARQHILQRNGLNILLNLLACGGDSDIAVSMSCCRAIQLVCESPSAPQYPVEKAAVFYLSTAMRNSFGNPIFCYTAFNCVCNFTHNNDAHRDYIVGGDEFNGKIVDYILEGMNRFRYSEDDITQNHHCEKVQISAMLALQNIAATPRGRSLIGTAGVEVVLDGFLAHVENNAVVSAALGTLINLCADKGNAQHFVRNDGLGYLLNHLQMDSFGGGGDDKIKITICRILRNIALEAETAQMLVQQEELDDVVTALLINADYGSRVFDETLQLTTALVSTLQRDYNQDLNRVMHNLYDKGLFAILCDALDSDAEQEHDKQPNPLVVEIHAHIAAILNAYVLSKNVDIRGLIFESADEYDAHSFVPGKLIGAAHRTPSAALAYSTNSIFFHCLDEALPKATLVRKLLLELGILDYLLKNTKWYRAPDVHDNAIALGCGIVLYYLQTWYVERQSNAIVCDWDLAHYKSYIEALNDYIKSQKLAGTPSQQLQQTQPKLEQFIKAIPVLLKKYPQ
eukprot:CAMPEP_0202687288 /NCGR_PEP_ID=MMETSP1385-20130828/2985_1 /ASSEMBLY_ACC=CAM_ASM_000861 /TAXON_ID=933848 /ORGANISM="Elphidium margaritaceum" /LENGTH=830 /DNA_ID=CAMNT_0049342055 /DNA_START=33 /DNA_END=2525 /DNA_ORIENTATION=-